MLYKKMVVSVVVLFHLISASVLSDRAANLSARQWMPLTINNASLNSLDLHYSLLYWNDSGVWDPIKQKIRWVGGPGTCCANPAEFKMINYDVAADSFSLHDTPYSGSGHAYDGNAFNPHTGHHYFAIFGSPNIRVWNDTAWSNLPTAPISGTTPSLTWFPDVNGGQGVLMFLGNSGALAQYDGISWRSISGISLGSINSFSEYNPVLKKVWIGGGNGTGKKHYLLDTNMVVTPLPNAPFELGNGIAYHTCDPVSGNFLVFVKSTKAWWEFNPVAGTWETITDMTPVFTFPSTDLFHVPIPEYGVILFFFHSGSAKYVYLYRHTAFDAVEEGGAVSPDGELAMTVSPNPFNPVTTISYVYSMGSGVETQDFASLQPNPIIHIYDITGKMVADLSNQIPHSSFGIRHLKWDATGHPSGIYIARLKTKSRTYQTRLMLTK
jgi:hypothetical protein